MLSRLHSRLRQPDPEKDIPDRPIEVNSFRMPIPVAGYCWLDDATPSRVPSEAANEKLLGPAPCMVVNACLLYTSLLRDARNKRFDQILVYRLDRIGRDTRLILNAVAEFEKCGVRVKSMTEEFDTSSATGLSLIHI